MEDTQRASLGQLGAWLGVGGNLFLTTIKLIVGLIGNSQGLIAEAIHSGADLLSSIGVLVGMKISSKPADLKHPYGHGKAESIAAAAVSVVLILTGVELAVTGVEGILSGVELVPSPITLYVAIFTVFYNEILFRYRLNIGKKINSPAIISDAWHQRADVFACVAVVIGIIGARMGFPIADPAAAAVVSVFIIKAGWDLIKDALNQLMDAAADEKTNETIRDIMNSEPMIKKVNLIRTRHIGGGLVIDLRFQVDYNLTIDEAHQLAVCIKDKLTKELPTVKDVSTHYWPYSDEEHQLSKSS